MAKKAVGIVLAVIFMMNIASCKQEKNAVIIGVNYEGSGALASYGKAMLDGVRLAVEELGDGYRLVCADNRSFGADSAAAIPAMPPPTTATSRPRKNEPSQTAQ